MIEAREQAVVMPVVLRKSGSHEEAVAAVATAVLRAYVAAPAGDPVWARWLAHEEGKTVRRANDKDFAKVEALGAHLGDSEVGGARALAFAPTSYEEMDRRIRRLQVGDTDFPRAGREPERGSPTVYLNAGLGMTTGKSCAQAAHALLGWWQSLDADERSHVGVPEDVRVVELPPREFSHASESVAPFTLIYDAGHTEIAPGSATAFVVR